MQIDLVSFSQRDDRAQFVAKTFKPLLRGKVLDVGCDTRRLKTLAPDTDYIGIDVGGDPDLVINLEDQPILPFDDRQFDCVVCTDVLEHLNNMHQVFDELARVTAPGGHLIISLPNCWRNLRRRIARGEGTPRYYGLPADPPEDRHKWFFNVDDVISFMNERAPRQGLRVKEFRVSLKPQPLPRRLLDRALHATQRRYLNRHAHSIWTLLERP